MQSFIIMLLICSVTMSALALFYMAVTPLLAKRYSVSCRYYAWLVVVIGFIIPFRPQFSNAIVKVDIPSNTVVPNIQIGNGTPVTAPLENALPSALPTISLWQVAAIVWFVGMIVFLAYHVIKHYHFLKLLARWSKDITDEQTLTLMQSLKSQMGLSKNIGLQFCDSIGSPMMIGFAHPRILLPKTDFAKDELSFILKHELVHYQRKDLWYKCLVLIATAIHWFNPIVYLMAKTIDIQCELSCDEKVVRGTSADTRLFYSETIIGVVRHQSKLKTALSTNFYGGKKGMKKRIFSIMDMGKKKVGLTILCSVLVLTLGTGFAFSVNAETQGSRQLPDAGVMEQEKSQVPLGTEADYQSVLALKTADYKNLTVAEFNNSLLEWSTQNGEGAYATVIENDIAVHQFPEYLSVDERNFLSLTVTASNTENSVQMRSYYGKPSIDPDLSFELIREDMEVDPPIWTQLMYGFSYHFDANKVTVGERDLVLAKVINEVQDFWNSTDIDKLASMTTDGMLKQLKTIVGMCSTETVEISVVENYFMFQTSKMIE